MPIKSFRAKLADGQQLKVRLGTNNGMTGYNIKKFQLFPAQPGAVRQESCVKLYTVAPAAVDAIVNYDDSTLLGSAVITGDTTQVDLPNNEVSGLIDSTKVLKSIDGIEFIFLTDEDVVRHKLVKKIIKAYNKLGTK